MQEYKEKYWIRNEDSNGTQYVVSTKQSLFNRSFIQSAFSSDEMFWAKSMSDENLETLLDNSLTFGLYIYNWGSATESLSEEMISSIQPEQLTQIGMGRMATDYMTFAWLSDVFVVPEYRGLGLGTWMIQSIGEVLGDMKRQGALRRIMLLTSHGVPIYRRLLGLEVFDPNQGVQLMTSRPE